MFNFPISLDHKNRSKSVLVSKHYVNFDFTVKRLTNSWVTFPGSFYSGMQKIRMIDVIALTLPSRPREQNDWKET